MLGHYEHLTNDEYHGHKESISRSALLDFSISPYTYWAKHLNPARPIKESSPQMILGSAFHTLILELKLFDEEYVVKPPKVLLKDVGRTAYDLFKNKEKELELSNKIVLDADDYKNLLDMQDRLYLNEQALELIKDARIEHSFFWEDKQSGLLLKCRPDALQRNIIIDLKTCADASEKAIRYEVFARGYDIQMAMMRDGIEANEGHRIENFILVCVENKYPHNTAIHILDEEIVDNAKLKYKSMLLQMKKHKEANEWPDFGVNRILLPTWEVYSE
jgi:PDDEXK-like uncharacterized protein DUF3799